MDRNNKSPEIHEITKNESKTTKSLFSNESHPIMAQQSNILGASNCTRLDFENTNVDNLSVAGTTLNQVQTLFDKSDSQVDSAVLSLGNDVAQYIMVFIITEHIIVNVITCVENVKYTYPNVSIGVCSILPRR
jgi:hypothetical protein